MQTTHNITACTGESKQEFILSTCEAQQQDGTIVFFDANLSNFDLINDIPLLKDSIKHSRFSHQYNLQIIYRWYIGTPDGVIAQTEEIGKVNAR